MCVSTKNVLHRVSVQWDKYNYKSKCGKSAKIMIVEEVYKMGVIGKKGIGRERDRGVSSSKWCWVMCIYTIGLA